MTGTSSLWGNPGSQAHSRGWATDRSLEAPGKPGCAHDRGWEDLGEGSSLRDQCLRDKGDTDFHGKHSLHITQCLLRDSFFHIFNIPTGVLGDEEDR